MGGEWPSAPFGVRIKTQVEASRVGDRRVHCWSRRRSSPVDLGRVQGVTLTPRSDPRIRSTRPGHRRIGPTVVHVLCGNDSFRWDRNRGPPPPFLPLQTPDLLLHRSGVKLTPVSPTSRGSSCQSAGESGAGAGAACLPTASLTPTTTDAGGSLGPTRRRRPRRPTVPVRRQPRLRAGAPPGPGGRSGEWSRSLRQCSLWPNAFGSPRGRPRRRSTEEVDSRIAPASHSGSLVGGRGGGAGAGRMDSEGRAASSPPRWSSWSSRSSCRRRCGGRSGRRLDGVCTRGLRAYQRRSCGSRSGRCLPGRVRRGAAPLRAAPPYPARANGKSRCRRSSRARSAGRGGQSPGKRWSWWT